MCDTLKYTTCQLSIYVVFVYLVGNANNVKKPKIAVENAQNNAFRMNIFFEKNVVSVWQRSIMLDVRKSAFKSPVSNVKKCHLSVIQKVSLLSHKIYIY